jgi:phenylalanyl-tRNA synthetase beta chain
VDFFALKGVLESLAEQLDAPLEVAAGSEPFLHPGRAGRVSFGGRAAGWIGELHPLVCRAWDVEGGTAFEIDLAELVAASRHGREEYEDVISYPAVHQDIAVVVDEGVTAEQVRAAVLEGGGELLRSARVFDLYRGEQIGGDRKSLALRLEFRAADRTLTEEEVAERRTAITEALSRIGGSLRE